MKVYQFEGWKVTGESEYFKMSDKLLVLHIWLILGQGSILTKWFGLLSAKKGYISIQGRGALTARTLVPGK